MTHTTDFYAAWLEQHQEQELAQWLRFAEDYATRWLRRRNATSIAPLCEQDLEDILSEARIAVLRFKLPEHAERWEPCLTGFVQQVCQRAYCRALRARKAHYSLEALPEPLHPCCETPTEHLDEEQLTAQVAALLQTMPVHHAAAFVLALEAELAQALAQHGALDETYEALTALAPLPDKAIAQILNLTPRAVIRARQHAREKLQKRLGG
jgi:RNA polymerase sigma factor (sigma-70 family)